MRRGAGIPARSSPATGNAFDFSTGFTDRETSKNSSSSARLALGADFRSLRLGRPGRDNAVKVLREAGAREERQVIDPDLEQRFACSGKH